MDNTLPIEGEAAIEEVQPRRGYGRPVAVGLLVALLALLGWGLQARAGGGRRGPGF